MSERCSLPLEKRRELAEFWPTMEPLRVIAERWNCSEAYVSTQAKRMGLPTRRHRMHEIRDAARGVPMTCNEYLRSEAARRLMTPDELKTRLIDRIIRDKLVDAVLDDADRRAA